jgi:hypothetical protein
MVVSTFQPMCREPTVFIDARAFFEHTTSDDIVQQVVIASGSGWVDLDASLCGDETIM